MTTYYQTISLLHTVLKTEIDEIIGKKSEIEEEVNKSSKQTDEFVKDFEKFKEADEKKDDDLKKLFQMMK